MKDLELLFKETESKFDKLQETKSEVMSSIKTRHQDLDDAVSRLLKIIDGDTINHTDYKSNDNEFDKKSKEIDNMLEETSNKLNKLLDELLS